MDAALLVILPPAHPFVVAVRTAVIIHVRTFVLPIVNPDVVVLVPELVVLHVIVLVPVLVIQIVITLAALAVLVVLLEIIPRQQLIRRHRLRNFLIG